MKRQKLLDYEMWDFLVIFITQFKLVKVVRYQIKCLEVFSVISEFFDCLVSRIPN
jgi:hypothetical protein